MSTPPVRHARHIMYANLFYLSKRQLQRNAFKGFCLTGFWSQTSSTIFLPRNKFYIVSGKVYLDCVHYSFQKMIKSVVTLYSNIMFHGQEPNHHYSFIQEYIIFFWLLLLSDILVFQHVNFQKLKRFKSLPKYKFMIVWSVKILLLSN